MKKVSYIFIGVLLLLLVGGEALAQGGDYHIGRWVISSGGAERSSEHYTGTDVIGQPASGHAESDNFVLDAGFLSPLQQPTTTPTPTPPPDGEGEGCFIATAAYGTSTAAEIDTLRAFRDEVLLGNGLGSQLVDFYYDVSPPVADFISENSLLRTIVRELLVDPVASLVEATVGLWRD